MSGYTNIVSENLHDVVLHGRAHAYPVWITCVCICSDTYVSMYMYVYSGNGAWFLNTCMHMNTVNIHLYPRDLSQVLLLRIEHPQ